MNRHLLIIFLLFPFLPVCAQFVWSNPQPSGFQNSKIIFTDALTGYITNYDGDLLRTVDGGNKWSIYKNFPFNKTMDVKDTFLVLGGGDTTVNISTDRGQTWKKGVMKHHSSIDKIQIINKDTIFALCKDFSIGITELFQSKDGGITWQLKNNTLIIKSVDFINSNLGYASSFGGLFKTTNGGVSWDTIYHSNNSILTVGFRNQDVGVIYEEVNRVVRTQNGGVTWDTCIRSALSDIRTISFVNNNTIFLGGDEGTIYRSTDGGQNWQLKYNHLANGYAILSIHFINATNGFFVGDRGQIFKTTDTGNSYTDYSPTYETIKPISFPTPAVGYMSSWNELFKTTDTGQTWSKLPFTPAQPRGRWFQQMHFFSKDTGIALLQDPVAIYKTENGGLTWRSITLPALYTDQVIGFFVLGNTIYLNTNGAYGYITFQSKDRGETWRIQEQNVSHGCRNMFFTDEKNGYGSSGIVLYKTTDSAKTWSSRVLTDVSIISGIWFTDAATGYLVSSEANYTTSDSGRTWTRFGILPNNFNFDELFAIRFFDKRIGYLTSTYARIYKTFDAGKSWRPDKSQSGSCMTIQMTADTIVFMGGVSGIIIKKDMREYSIDSLRVVSEAACSVRINADVTAVLSKVDSIWVEYGTTAFTKSMLATPVGVKDSTVRCDVTIQNINPDSNYVVRIKILYRNKFYFSDPITFHPTVKLAKPVITLTGTLLNSSAPAGNQWYLNAVAIPGATNNTYQPVASGTYTVQQTINGCSSAVSAGFNFAITATNDLLLAAGITIFPNPVSTTLWIKNKQAKRLLVTLTESWGRTVLVKQTAKTENMLDVQHLSAGIYLIQIEDLSTHKWIGVKLVKQ